MAPRILKPEIYGKGLKGMWHQGWSEVPHYMLSAIYPILCVPIFIYIWKRNNACQVDEHIYKTHYTVYRPSDLRVTKMIRKFNEEKVDMYK